MKEEKTKEDEHQEEPEDEDIDISTVEDVCNIRDGEPLFSNFGFEDWTLMSLRFEMHLLVKAFEHDTHNPDRPGMLEGHLPFYYNKYYRKPLNTKFYGMSSLSELLGLVKDTVVISESSIIKSQLEAHLEHKLDIFVKMTEENRRERQRRIDAGDETAKLRLSVLRGQQPTAQSMPVRPAGIVTSVRNAFQPARQPPQQQPRMPWTPMSGAQPGCRPMGVRWPIYAPKAPTWR